MFSFKNISLISITILATFLRFFLLGSNPPSLNLDEVAIGYNAYSILKIGKDEYGTTFPVAFRSHDDYKAPLYIYLTSASIAAFGLNEFAIRFPSALLGTLTIPVVYFLIYKLTNDKKSFRAAPHLAAFLLAISPWHIQFSRAAFETNIAVFFFTLGIYAFFKSMKNQNYWFITSIMFALSIYSYHTARIFIPLFTIYLIWLARTKIISKLKTFILASLLFIFLLAPLAHFMLLPQAQLRFKGTSIFETPTLIQTNQDQKIDQTFSGRPLQAKIFHNKYISGVRVLLIGYFKHWSYDFLFEESGLPKNHTTNTGLLYLWELVSIPIGVYVLFRHKFKYKTLILVWIIIAPIASAITWDAPSSTRTTIILPTLQILSSLGLIKLFYLVSPKFKKYFAAATALTILFFTSAYLHNYYYIAPKVFAHGWQHGYKQAVLKAQNELNTVDQIIVSTNLKQPQNFFAFYLQYDPDTYLNVDGGTVSGGFNETDNSFGKFKFKPIDWQVDAIQPNTLYIDLSDNVPNNFPPKHQISLPSGQPNITIYQAN